MQAFTDKQIELVTTYADQAAIAIENVRLFEAEQQRTHELAKSLEDLQTAQDRLVQTQKLASLGQLTAGRLKVQQRPLSLRECPALVPVKLFKLGQGADQGRSPFRFINPAANDPCARKNRLKRASYPIKLELSFRREPRLPKRVPGPQLRQFSREHLDFPAAGSVARDRDREPVLDRVAARARLPSQRLGPAA